MSESEPSIKEVLSSSRNRRTASKSTAASLAAANFGKLPPQAVDLEEAVLGALMLEKNALTSVIDILHPEAFYKDTHRIIFKAIRELFNNTQPIDILTVTNQLKSTGELDIVGGPITSPSLPIVLHHQPTSNSIHE
jgi:replicative DNA helicase